MNGSGGDQETITMLKPNDQFAYEVDGRMVSAEQVNTMLLGEQEKVRGELVTQRDEWVSYRSQSGVETRWRRSSALYHGDEGDGESVFVETLKTGAAPSKRSGKNANRSRVVVNIVRPKVDQAIARMCEILLPVDDRNWGIRPTPLPSTAAERVGDARETVDPETGQPTGMTADDEVFGILTAAKEACSRMERQIFDNLVECAYNGEQRKGIENGVRLGPMILKGPYLSNQVGKSWRVSADGTAEMIVSKTVVPASMACDPWDVWFDPACGNDHQRGAGYYHRRFVTRKELRGLIDVPGFDSGAIKAVLMTAPTRVQVAEGRVVRSICKEHSYELWEYHGEIEPDAMATASMNTGDPLEDVSFGVVLMVNDKVIGAMESWIEDRSLPIDVWCWRKSDSDPYGYGLPWEMESQQRVVNGAWRQVMDNARIAVGGQVVIKRKMITPQDGSFELTPYKIWDANPDVDDVTKAMTVFKFDSHLTELLTIAEAAMKFSDQETSMPQIMGGEKGTAPETVGGMVMLYNTASTVLRMRVKLYDDSITRPHIGRYYDWHMANNPDQKLKGDMEVDARGSTALLEKDIQNQTTMNLAAVTANPRYGAYLDPKKELVMILKAFKVQPDDLLLAPEVIKKNEQNPPETPPDPRIEAALISKEMKEMELADRAEDRVAKDRRNGELMQVKREQLAYNTERERTEAELTSGQMALTREIAISKIDSAERQVGAGLITKERLKLLELDTDRQKFSAEAALRVQSGRSD